MQITDDSLGPLIGSENMSLRVQASNGHEAIERTKYLAEIDYPDCDVEITGCQTKVKVNG